MDEDDIQLILRQYKSSFVNYETRQGVYSKKNISEDVCRKGDQDGTMQIEYDDVTMKTKLILTSFGSTFGLLRFDEKPFFSKLLGFKPNWVYKPTNAIHADNPDVYCSDINLNLSAFDKIHLKCNVIDGSIVGD